ncbi:MAG: sigma factor-like helix-turn-helix DNA-binding protein [Planctomycetota bacterium]
MSQDSLLAALAAARRGDRSAQDRLCLAFYPDVLAYARRKMGPRAQRLDSPESVANEGLAKTMREIGGLPASAGLGDLRARLYRNTWTRIANLVNGHEGFLGQSADAHPSAPPVPATRTTRTVTRRDQVRFLRALIRLLRPKYRKAVYLHAISGWSYDLIADRLGLRRDTAKRHYGRGVQALRCIVDSRTA